MRPAWMLRACRFAAFRLAVHAMLQPIGSASGLPATGVARLQAVIDGASVDLRKKRKDFKPWKRWCHVTGRRCFFSWSKGQLVSEALPRVNVTANSVARRTHDRFGLGIRLS